MLGLSIIYTERNWEREREREKMSETDRERERERERDERARKWVRQREKRTYGTMFNVMENGYRDTSSNLKLAVCT